MFIQHHIARTHAHPTAPQNLLINSKEKKDVFLLKASNHENIYSFDCPFFPAIVSDKSEKEKKKKKNWAARVNYVTYSTDYEYVSLRCFSVVFSGLVDLFVKAIAVKHLQRLNVKPRTFIFVIKSIPIVQKGEHNPFFRRWMEKKTVQF